MKFNLSVFNRGKKGGDTGRIGNTWTLRLMHTDERGNRTSKTCLAILKHLLIEAHDAGLIAKNVTRGSKAIDADAETARARTLTDAEEQRLLASCQGERDTKFERTRRKTCKERPGEKEMVKVTNKVDNPHLKAVILLGLDSGLRRGEILTLEWKDIDFRYYQDPRNAYQDTEDAVRATDEPDKNGTVSIRKLRRKRQGVSVQ